MMTAIEDLRWDWGEAYAIWRDGDVYWYAQNRATRTILKATSAERLRERIRADYKPVTKSSPTPPTSRQGSSTT